MKKIIVRGRHRLSGEIKISGSKNAVLPIIAASLLGSKGVSLIHEVPPLEDVHMINRVIEALGANIKFEAERETLMVDASRIDLCEAPYEWVRKMRASFLVMGPLLARCGEAKIPLPGGCAIGTRPIDQHLKGFEAMGAEIELGQGYIMAKANGKLKGAKIYLDVASVGATENIIMAASLAEGTTIIENAAKEPEIVDLANFINAMGGNIRGAGTGIIKIEGVEELAGCEHSVIPDRIEAGTYMIAAAITGGNVLVEGAIEDHLKPVISKLQEMGVTILKEDKGLRVKVDKPLNSVDVKTLPYPGFPTDMQSQIMALLLVTNGSSIVTETVFENRFMHVEAFRSMNARIKVDGRSAVISGNSKLIGSKVCATDLRAGAALILAALAAENETEITGVHHIERGYLNIVGKLSQVGASIKLLDTMENPITIEDDQQQVVGGIQPSWA